MLHIVTVATESRYYFPYLYDTCQQFGSTLKILGYNEKWNGYVFKLEKMIDFLRDVDPYDIVCFVDGYDVICTRNLDDLVPTFLNTQALTGCSVVIAKDSGVIPSFIADLYFGKCSKNFINTGTYIGFAGDILDILLEARDLYPNERDDQRLITRYCDMFPRKFHVDEHGLFFQCYVYPLTQASIQGTPFFVHAPGCGYLDDILENMGYQVDPNIKTELKKYFFRKAGEHTGIFLKRYAAWIVIVILVIIVLTTRV